MWVIQFFRPVLQALDKGDVIRTAVVLALRVFGVLTALSGIYLLVEILKVSFKLETRGTIGGLVFSIILVAAYLALFQTYFYRAESVRDLGESPFTVIPIVSILLRLLGEVYATFGVTVAIGGCLFIWLSGLSPIQLIPGIGLFFPAMGGGGTFLDGLIFLVSVGLLSFGVVVVFYFLAEAIVVLVDIARNIRVLVKQSATGDLTKALQAIAQLNKRVAEVPTPTPAPATAASAAGPTSGRATCKKCGARLLAGSSFCDECGTAAG